VAQDILPDAERLTSLNIFSPKVACALSLFSDIGLLEVELELDPPPQALNDTSAHTLRNLAANNDALRRWREFLLINNMLVSRESKIKHLAASAHKKCQPERK
jgi:hypothetical protein